MIRRRWRVLLFAACVALGWWSSRLLYAAIGWSWGGGDTYWFVRHAVLVAIDDRRGGQP